MASRIAELAVKITANTTAIKGAFAEVNRDLADTVRKATATSAGFSSFGKALTSAGTSLSVGISLPLAGVAVQALKASANLETARAAFETMTGSAAKANTVLKQVQDFAARTPFEFPELVRSSQKLLAFGFSADRLIPILNSVGSAVSAVGGGSETLDRVTLALGQISAKGKVSAEELNQLAETGLPVREILAKSFGVTQAELVKLVEKGVVPAKEAIDALLKGFDGRFGGSLEKQSKTLTGIFSNLKDQVTASLTKIGDVLAPTAKRFATEFVAPMLTKVEDLAGGFSKLPAGVQDTILALGGFTIAAGPAVFVAGQLVTAIQGIVTAGKALVALNLPTAVFGSLGGRVAIVAASIAALAFALEQLERRESAARSKNVPLEENLRGNGGMAAIVESVSNSRAQNAYEDTIKFVRGLGQAKETAAAAVPPSKDFADALDKIRNNAEKTEKVKLPDWFRALGAQIERLLSQIPSLDRAWANVLRDEAFNRAQAGFKALQKASFDYFSAAEPFGKKVELVYSNISSALGLMQIRLEDVLLTQLRLQRQTSTENLEGQWKDANRELITYEDLLRKVGVTTQREIVERLNDVGDALERARAANRAGADNFAEILQLQKLQKDLGERFNFGDVVSRSARKPLLEVSTVTTNLSQSLARLAFEGGRFGEVMANVGKQVGQSFTANLIEKLVTSSGLLDGMARKLGSLLKNIPGLGKLGGIFGGAGSAASSAANAAGGIGTGTASGAASAAASSGLSATIGAIGSVASAISGIIGNFQQATTNRRLGQVEENTRGALNQSIAQQETFNLYLPKLAEIQALIKQVITYGLGVYSQPASVVRVFVEGGSIGNMGAGSTESLSLLAQISEQISKIRTEGLGVYPLDRSGSLSLATAGTPSSLTLNVQGSIFGFGTLSDFTDALVEDLQRRGVQIKK